MKLTNKVTRDRCYDFKNIFAQKFGVFCSKYCYCLKKMIITLVFEINANFFAEKLAKIAENCDHNIDPRCVCEKNAQHAAQPIFCQN
jgi:hypothetical protein